MGAGASSMQELDLGVTTLVLGQALAAITFPDMFRLHDFHSPKAPRLRSMVSITWFGGIQDLGSDEQDDDYETPPPEQYEHLFHVQLGDQMIYIDDVLAPNALGWTPLHACCHSSSTMGAAFKVIEEIQRRGGNFDCKTLRGPGIFNAGWTALHMATAYGLEPVVAMILHAGGDPNCRNSYGFTPLFEASHRGFTGIARLLIEAKADLNALPTEEEADNCPLLSAPPQTPLAEAARFGFTPIVELLLEAGAAKDFRNSVGWTPLHEAAFYNHARSVQLLLVHGADPTIKCERGLVPWQVTRSTVVKEMLADIGGPAAVVMTETQEQVPAEAIRHEDVRAHKLPVTSSSPERQGLRESAIDETHAQATSPQHQKSHRTPRQTRQNDSLLGDLPALNSKTPVQAVHTEMQDILEGASEPKALSPSLKVRSPKKHTPSVPKDAPHEFICALSKQLMCDPVRTIYGQVFEKEMILSWIEKHGHICPITAMPLAESDFVTDTALRDRILAWKMGKTMQQCMKEQVKADTSSSGNRAHDEDDLYEF